MIEQPGRIHRAQLVHHLCFGQGVSGADTSFDLGMDGQTMGAASTVNPGFPRAVRAIGVWLNTGTLGVTTPGNWNLRLRINRSGADSATFTFNPTTANDVFSGNWSSQIIINPTDQYNIITDGPTRVVLLVRATLEFEII